MWSLCRRLWWPTRFWPWKPHRQPFRCSKWNPPAIALKWVANRKTRERNHSPGFPSIRCDPMECPYLLAIAHAAQLLANPMVRSAPAWPDAGAALRTTPWRTRTAAQAVEVAQKCNGMGRRCCSACGIVGTPAMTGIAPGTPPAQTNYCSEYDWPGFRRRSLHPDARSYSVGMQKI